MKKTIAFMLSLVLLISVVTSALLITPASAAAPLLSENFNTISEGNGLTYSEAGRFAATLTGNNGWVATNNTNGKFRKPAILEGALNIRGEMRIAKIIGKVNTNNTIKVNFKWKNTGTAASAPMVFYIAKLSDAAKVSWESNNYYCGGVWNLNVSENYANKDVTLKVPSNWENTDEPLVFGIYYNPYIGSKEVDTPNVFIDDLTVQEYIEPQHTQSGLLLDGDFEYYKYNLGKLPNSLGTNRLWGGQGTTYVQEEDGNICISMNWRTAQYVPDLKSNTTYILTKYYKKNPTITEPGSKVAANYWVGITKLNNPFDEKSIIWLNKAGYHATLPETYTEYKSIFTTPELDPNEKYGIVMCSPNTGDRMLVDNISLEKKVYVEPSVNGVLLDGDFSASMAGKMPAIDSNDAKNSQVWSGSTVVKDPQDESNLCTTFSWELQQYVPKLKSNTTYYLTYKYKNNPATEKTSANFWTSVVELGKRDTVGEMNNQGFINSSNSEWKLVKREFTTGDLEPGKKYAIRFCSPATGDNVLLDDIGLYEKATALSVDTTSYRGGSAAVSSPYCAKGNSVTFTAKEDGNCTFLGWLKNGDASQAYVSTDLIYTTQVTESLKLVAVFKQKGYDVNSDTFLNPGAEDGELNYWKDRYPEKSSQLTVDSTVSHSGKYSFKFTAEEPGIYRAQTVRGILLRPNCRYTLRVWVKTEGVSPFRFAFFDGAEMDDYREGSNDFVFPSRGLHPDLTVIHTCGGVYSVTTTYSSWTSDAAYTSTSTMPGHDDDGWVELTSTFETSAADAGNVLNIMIGMQETSGTIWIDDLSASYEELDVSTQKAKKPYTEWSQNRIKNGDFEKTLADTTLNAPQGWQIVKDGTASERTAYLKIPANSGVYVKEMAVDNMRWSVLAYYLKTNKAGTSYIGLTDQDPTQNADFSNPQALGIYNSKPTTQWQRDGWQMFANNFKKMWIVIYSGSNDLYLDQLQFFYGDYGYDSDPNDYDLTDTYDYDGDGVLATELDLSYKDEIQQVFGAGAGAPEDYDSNTAATGDYKTVLPVVLILLSSAAICTLAFRKGKVNHEK